MVVNGVDTTIGEGCWWRRWVGINIYDSNNWIVMRGENMRRDCDRVKGSIGRSYDEIEGLTVSVSRNFNI